MTHRFGQRMTQGLAGNQANPFFIPPYSAQPLRMNYFMPPLSTAHQYRRYHRDPE
jgi:hypothetical protein